MPDASQIAAAINLRVRQLEAQGMTGIALANHMIGHMQDLHRIYNTTSDRTLCDLCCRFPGFERYARLMEEVSEQNQAMMAAGAHPYGDLPELPEPLKASLLHVMHAAAELESEFQAAIDDGREDQAERLTAMRRRWADDLRKLVLEFRSSGLPLRTQALVQQAVKAVAERIERMRHE
jgi:hypothetical protein